MLLVCQQDYAKTTEAIFTKFDRKAARASRKIALDFDGALVMVRLKVG